MKPENLLILAALAGAAFLVFAPRKASAASAQRVTIDAVVGKGDASTIWTESAQSAYRAQLQRELTAAGDFYI